VCKDIISWHALLHSRGKKDISFRRDIKKENKYFICLKQRAAGHALFVCSLVRREKRPVTFLDEKRDIDLANDDDDDYGPVNCARFARGTLLVRTD
jgi:hypothetical protein